MTASQALSQLSYSPTNSGERRFYRSFRVVVNPRYSPTEGWQLCGTLRGARQLARGDSEVRLSNDGVASVDDLRSMPG